jgi:hypothetical protein
MLAWFLCLVHDLPLWTATIPVVAPIAEVIMDIPYVAAQRGILLASATGTVILGIRALIGKEPGLLEMEAV